MTVVPLVTAALAAAPPETTEQASHVYEQRLEAAPERVLPLLTPLGERAWAAGWDPVLRWEPPGGGAGTLFVIRHPGPGLDPLAPRHVGARGRACPRYVHVTPGSGVTEIDIQLRPEAKDGA